VDVAITDLRAHLRDWLARVRDGEELVVTDRGRPVARITGLDEQTSLLERLTAEGVIARPKVGRRPKLSDLQVPRPRRPASDVISEQRR
jgi:prevent-host-death family protein